MDKNVLQFLDELNSKETIDDSLCYVYDKIDDLFFNKELNIILDILNNIDPSTIDVSCSIGILIITNTSNDLINLLRRYNISNVDIDNLYKSRILFYNKLESFLIKDRGRSVSKSLLENLKPTKINK